MTVFDLQSERVGATGNLASEGVLNQLGRPRLDPLTVLVRESAQNSWDARASDLEPVRFGLAGWTLRAEQLGVLRDQIFTRDPPGGLSIRPLLDREIPIEVLAVYDRGTRGLAGPTRADAPIQDPSAPRNFVNFLRNIGQPSGQQFGGGTYGYGKAAMFQASDAHALCVHTRCIARPGIESRFMAAALGLACTIPAGPMAGNYTGRHWWGRQEDDVVEPLRGLDADRIATELGLPAFRDDLAGTTLLIIGPRMGNRTAEQAMRFMAQAFLWNFWPKLLSRDDGTTPMELEVSWEGKPIDVPHPRDFPPLEGFVQAHEHLKDALRGAPPSSVFSAICPIDSQRPIRRLGMLSLQRFQRQDRPPVDVGEESDSAPIGRLSHHVALLRQPELVVHYLEGPQLASDQIEYAGVFLTEPDLDATFARAEPPTHDDWVVESLENPAERSAVRIALRKINDELSMFTSQPPVAGGRVKEPMSLGSLGDELGALIPALTRSVTRMGALIGEGEYGHAGTLGPDAQQPAIRGSGAQTSGKAQRARVVTLDAGRIEVIGGRLAVTIKFEVLHAAGTPWTLVRAEAGAVLDNDELERDPPRGVAVPEVLFWTGPDGTRGPAPQIRIPSDVLGIWEVSVSLPGDARVGVDLSVGAPSA